MYGGCENALCFTKKRGKNVKNGNSEWVGKDGGSKAFACRFGMSYVSESCGTGRDFEHFLATCHSWSARWGTGTLRLG